MPLWGGRFNEAPDAFFAEFSSSFRYDRRLLVYDVAGSRAWAFALVRAGVLKLDEVKRIARGLRMILKKARAEPGWLDQYQEEDVHTFVEARLFEMVGEPALRLHTGRSRNDQVALDVRLYVKDRCESLRKRTIELGHELLRLAERHPEAVLPGYTHLRRAQPVLLAHYLLAYVEMLLRDLSRMRDMVRRADVLPLGSGALAGTGYPIDRERLARRLGFREFSSNSMDAVSDRDFVVELLAFGALLGVHLSRLAEDLILYSSKEFELLVLADDVSTGSSLMPQKKNPDSLELIRGKCGRLIGNLTSALTMLKGLPMTYNRDLQEDKEPLFDTVETLEGCLRVASTVVRGLKVDVEKCRSAACGDFTNATDLADYLVKKGVPFRTAHKIVGKVVLACIEHKSDLEQLPLAIYRQVSEHFQEDLYQHLTLESSLGAHAVAGGTSPVLVAVALKRAHKQLLKA